MSDGDNDRVILNWGKLPASKIDEPIPGSKRTVLMHLSAMNGIAEVENFLARKPNVHAKSGQGNTALHFVAYNTSPSAAKIADALVKAGADIFAKNDAGQTPRELAQHWQNTDAEGFLAALEQNSGPARDDSRLVSRASHGVSTPKG